MPEEMKAFKRWVAVSAPESFKRRPYVSAWLKGEISDELYLLCNREWMAERGMKRASGSWWPADIEDKGCEIEEGKLFVKQEKARIPDSDNPGKTKEVVVSHPAWRRYLRDLEIQERAGRYTEHIAKGEPPPEKPYRTGKESE